MLNLIRQRRPEVTMMITTNASVNAPMLSINQRLGFQVHRQEGTYQIDREALACYLARASS